MNKVMSAFVFSILVAISAIVAAPVDFANAAISLTPVPKSFDPARPSAIPAILNADLAIIQSGVLTSASGVGLANSKLADSVTAPTIASGFGTSPSIVASNGTAAFVINVGTGGTAASGVVAMPTASTGWLCSAFPASAPQAGVAMYSVSTSASSVTITNYTISTASSVAWTSGNLISVQCRGY